MKVDFNKKFVNFNGEVLKDANTQREITLGEVCVEALLSTDRENPISGTEKLERYNLAMEIHSGKKEVLSPEEIVLIKELVGKLYTTIIVGQAFPILDGE